MTLPLPTKRPMTLSAAGVLLGSVLLSAGCVTINIYFPAAAAEKAADRIIDEVWQLKGGAAPAATPSAKPIEK